MNRSLDCFLTATGWWRRAEVALVLMCMAASASIPVHAALGGLAASIQSDAVKLQGRVESSPSCAKFTKTTISLPSGTVINEYVSPAGKVFALSWHGLRPPDLSQFLGLYYPDYKAALAGQPRPWSHHIMFNTGGMIFEVHGHMRDMRGSAYLPALVPAGLSLEDLH